MVEAALFEIIFEQSTSGIAIITADGKIIQVNKAIKKLFGYPPHAILNNLLCEQLIPERLRQAFFEGINKLNQNTASVTFGEKKSMYGLKKDGTEFPIEIKLVSQLDKEVLYIIVFINDISIRKDKDSSLHDYQLKVNEILASLRKEKELNDLKSQFVSLASHEFKTPLSTILSSASLIEKYTTTEENAKREKHIERIKSAVGNLNGILNEFLAIGKIENGRIGVHYLDFDIEDFIEAVCMEMQDIKKHNQTLTSCHYGAKEVFMDVDLLRNILNNLITNAIKFTGTDGHIQVISRNTAKTLTITVKDDGIGISKPDQKHLFERFFRGKNVLNISGTGLGLHIVDSYVKLLHGSLQIKSQLRKGTEITLKFTK